MVLLPPLDGLTNLTLEGFIFQAQQPAPLRPFAQAAQRRGAARGGARGGASDGVHTKRGNDGGSSWGRGGSSALPPLDVQL